MMKKYNGFTLIELLVVVIVVGILVKFAVSNYQSYVMQSRRSDAVNTLYSVSLAEERYRSNNSTYGTLAQVSALTTSAQGYYTIAASNIAAGTYTLTATAIGQQANDTANGSSCATMTMAWSNGTSTLTPAVCWPS